MPRLEHLAVGARNRPGSQRLNLHPINVAGQRIEHLVATEHCSIPMVGWHDVRRRTQIALAVTHEDLIALALGLHKLFVAIVVAEGL